MKAKASLDVDVIGLERDEDVIVMLQLRAPERLAAAQRADAVVEVHVD